MNTSTGPSGLSGFAALGSPENPRQVAQVSDRVASILSTLPATWIEGEITQANPRRTGIFLTLKDMKAVKHLEFFLLPGTCPTDLKVGERVKIYGKTEFWSTSGQIKIKGFELRRVGVGELIERIARLRQQLREEGLYEFKKPLPLVPKVIGLITGQNSDAEKDVVTNVRRRWPTAQFSTAYASMQGQSCVPETIAALKKLDADPAVEVIIIARGGGSFHDLLGFSDEELARAVFAARTPVISAIGHEADSPILDEVADCRASTPTDAAKRVVPDVRDELNIVRSARRLMNSVCYQIIVRAQQQVFEALQALGDPAASYLLPRQQQITDLRTQLSWTLTAKLTHTRNDLERLQYSLTALSPRSVLERGYSIVHDSRGGVVTSAAQLSTGDIITVNLAGGAVRAKVEGIEP